MKLPFDFKIPFIGEKTKLSYVYYEDDKFRNQYMLEVKGNLPESIVKRLYDHVLKKKTGVEFSAGLLDGKSVEVPKEFLDVKVGVFSWEDVLLKQLEKIFLRVSQKQGIIFLTRHISSLKITRRGKKYGVFFVVLGKKSAKGGLK